MLDDKELRDHTSLLEMLG